VTHPFSRHSAKLRTLTCIIDPQHFGNDLADIRIQIRINPEIRSSGSLWLRLDLDALAVWQRFASLSTIVGLSGFHSKMPVFTVRDGMMSDDSNYQIGQIGVNRTKSEIPIITCGHFARSYTI